MDPLERYLFLGINFITENLTLFLVLTILFIVLIFVSSFFSYVEAIFSTVNILRLRKSLEEKEKGSAKAVYISEKFDQTITTITIANSFIRIVVTFIFTFLLTKIIDNQMIAIIILLIVLPIIFMVFTEILPKSKGQNNPEKKASKNSLVLYFIIKLLSPFTYLYVLWKKKLAKKNDSTSESPKVTEEELESIIDDMETQGVFEEDDAEMIQNMITLSDSTVYDIMTPRVDMIAIPISATIEEFKEMFFEHQYSRMPVYDEDKDNILGILSEKDFFTALIKNKKFKIEDVMTEPYYVSATMKVNELIQDMRKVKKHFAIVVDEYGGTYGIVTMEDALEEIVGEIYDEFDDVYDDFITKIGEDKFLVDREMSLEEMFEILEIGEVPNTNFSTVGGFVYSLCEGLPTEGDIVSYNYDKSEFIDGEEVCSHYKLLFTIKKVEKKRIKKIELEIQKENKELEE